MFKTYWKLLQPFHRSFGWFVALLLVYEGLQIVEGYVISLVVRMYGQQAETWTWIAVFIGLVIYDELFMRLDNAVDWHILTRHSFPIYKHLKLGAIAKFLHMDMPWHQSHNSGALVGKVGDGVWKVIEILDGLSWEFIPTMIQVILSIIPLLYFSPQTAGVAVIAFGIFMYLSVKGIKELNPLREGRHDVYEREWHSSIELVQSVETNLIFGQRERLLREQNQMHDEILEFGRQEAHVGIYKYARWKIRILTISRRAILCLWVWQLFQGTMDIASLIFVSILTEKLFHSFWRFERLMKRATEASEGAKRLANLMAEENRISDAGKTPKVKLPVGIEIEDVTFAYNQNQTTLNEFSVEIKPGSVVALVGPSGAGKSTLWKLITGLVYPQKGQIKVGGIATADWSGPALRKLFSYIPQGDDVFIYADTMHNNIAYPRPNATRKEVERAAELAGIHEFIKKQPDGYDMRVGERGKRLSGGQKQRVAIARAILANRPILIMDEATSAVDAITEKTIQAQMREILKDKTAIIIAHRLSTIWDIADQIVVLEEGRKVEQGTHMQLMGQNGLYARMVALQTAETLTNPKDKSKAEAYA